MKFSGDKLEEYEKNLKCISDVMDKIMTCTKGRHLSYQELITNEEGEFEHEKLVGLLDAILSVWEEDVWYRANERRDIGKSIAVSYIGERKELFHNYLYAVMRCSLIRGAYREEAGSIYEKTDFKFVLEQAKEFAEDYICLCGREAEAEWPDGKLPDGRLNKTYYFLDGYFGFHLYSLLDEDGWRLDQFRLPGIEAYAQKVKEGYGKGMLAEDSDFVHDPLLEKLNGDSYFLHESGFFGEAPWTEDYALYGRIPVEPDEDEIQYWDDRWSSPGYQEWMKEEAERIELEENSAKERRSQARDTFKAAEDYLAACDGFKAAFRKVRPEVMRFFYEDIERAIDLYLMQTDRTLLNDVDAALNITRRLQQQILVTVRQFAEENA